MKNRKDGKLLKDINGMNYIMHDILKRRNDNEVYSNYSIDVTELIKYVKKINNKSDIHITYFHLFITALSKVFYNRPYLNRFIVNGKFYERNNITFAFVAKTKFTDSAMEVMQVLKVDDDDNIYSISKKVAKQVDNSRKSTTSSTDDLIVKIAKLPKYLRYFIVGCFKWADKHDFLPTSLTDELLYYSSAIVSNLGSIGSKSPIYHHLSSFGTNSIIITMGKVYKKEIINDNNKKEIRDFCDFGITLDERIADGFYMIESIKLFDYILNNPKLLEDNIGTVISRK